MHKVPSFTEMRSSANQRIKEVVCTRREGIPVQLVEAKVKDSHKRKNPKCSLYCSVCTALGEGRMLQCYKTFRRIPPPSTDGAGLILLGRGKRLLYMGREFAPSGTKVFRNHRKFPAIFTLKKGRMRMVGSNSVPLDYYSCPLPLAHSYHLFNVKKYTIINRE